MILIDSSDDEDEERITENGIHYTETYLHKNDGDHDEAVTARLRARLRKKPRFLHRYVIPFNDELVRKVAFFYRRNLQTSTDQPAPEIVTINNDYCRLDTKTSRRKPFHRAGFLLYQTRFTTFDQKSSFEFPLIFLSHSSVVLLES